MRCPFLLPLLLALSLFTGSCCSHCGWGGGTRIEGSGAMVEQPRELGTFDSVHLAGGMELRVRVGLQQRLVIHADENLQEYITTEVKDGELRIRFEENLSSGGTLRAEIDLRTLRELDVNGGATIEVIGVEGEKLAIDVSGSCTGAVSGWVDELDVDIAGSANLDLFELVAKSANVDIAGSGKLKLNATESLDVDVAGSADVTYRGEPRVSIDQAGSARVRSAQ